MNHQDTYKVGLYIMRCHVDPDATEQPTVASDSWIQSMGLLGGP